MLPIPSSPEPLPLRFDPTPSSAAISAPSREALLAGSYRVSPSRDRTGTRLEGPPIPITVEPSRDPEPVLPGTLQVTNDGSLLCLGPDAAVTGGYATIGVLRRTSLWALGRVRSGARVRFVP
jgi:allophanate hydrolase subunit 2